MTASSAPTDPLPAASQQGGIFSLSLSHTGWSAPRISGHGWEKKMSEAQAYDGESLPWLEAVENEDGPRAISARKMLIGLLLVVLAAAVVAGTMFWVGRQDPA